MMNTLTVYAISISACAFGLDALLLYRQMHIAPWDLEPTEPDLEALKQAYEEPAQVAETEPLVPKHRSTSPNPVEPTSYGAIPTEKDQDDVLPLDQSSSTEWPPPDAPRWLFGLKRSQYFLSPAERPPIFSRWYHIFKFLWPMLIVQEFLTPRPNPNQRELHPQANISILLFMFTPAIKLALGLLLYSDLDSKHPQSGFTRLLTSVEAWGIIIFIVFNNGIYWRSKSCGRVSGPWMGRLRILVSAAMALGLWVGACISSKWRWNDFKTGGLPLAIVVGMSYGLAWERWV